MALRSSDAAGAHSVRSRFRSDSHSRSLVLALGAALIGVVSIVSVAACGGSPSRPTNGDGAAGSMQVIVDANSGVPNPSVTLPAADAETFKQLVSALGELGLPDSPGDGRKLVPPSQLGYRGLLVTRSEDISVEIRYFSTEYGMVYVTERSGALRHKPDEGRTVERWLVSRLRGKIADGLYDEIVRGLPR